MPVFNNDDFFLYIYNLVLYFNLYRPPEYEKNCGDLDSRGNAMRNNVHT